MSAPSSASGHQGIKSYYNSKIDELEIDYVDKTQDLRRLEAQRNELNAKGICVRCVEHSFTIQHFTYSDCVASFVSPQFAS
jgi:hypothetical protein